MKLSHAKGIVNEPRYIEALKVIAEAEEVEIEKVVITSEDAGNVEEVEE